MRVFEIGVFVLAVVLWFGFAAGVLWSPSSVHEAWGWFGKQSLFVQIPLGVLLLPWVIGAWVWETSWPVVARVVLVAGLAWANVNAFYPWRSVA